MKQQFRFTILFSLVTFFTPNSLLSQCLTESEGFQFVPNPSNTIIDNGIEGIKLYIHVCEVSPDIPSLSDAEVEEMVQVANADFAEAGVSFFYCLDRIYNETFANNNGAGMSELGGSCNNYEGGINVFLMPKTYTYESFPLFLYGGGFAFNFINGATQFSIPAKNIMIFGQVNPCNFPLYPTGQRFCTIPHALSHELGHCLGLLHTHSESNGPTPLDNTGCATNGDLICDTQPAKNLNFCVNQNCQEVTLTFPSGCSFLSPLTHIPDPAYTPDLNNIMAYSNYISCSPLFTAGQSERIMQTVQNAAILQDCRYKVLSSGNTSISSSQIWPLPDFPPSGNVFVGGDLVIEPNATLEIQKGRVVFNANSKVNIKAKAKLKAQNAIFSSNCTTWKGITVNGGNSQNQALGVQGHLELETGAIVEHAETGANSLNGGIITTNGAVFRNNYFGVRLSPFNKPHAVTLFKNTLFITEPCDRFATYSPILGSARTHLTMNAVTGNPRIKVLGCKFSNATEVPRPTQTGILSNSSDIEVDEINDGLPVIPTAFNFLPYGVQQYLSKLNGSAVRNSKFIDCGVGIYANAPRFMDVYRNYFELGRMPVFPPYSAQFGVWFENEIQTCLFRENTFVKGVQKNYKPTIGSFAKNLGLYTHFFKENHYTNLSIGNLANGVNGSVSSGVVYLCNTNSGFQNYDFGVVASTVRKLQGQVDINDFLGAGNTFSYTDPFGDYSDFYNSGPIEIQYIFTDQSNQEPLDFLNIEKTKVQDFTCFQFAAIENESDLNVRKQAYRQISNQLDLAIAGLSLLPGNDSTSAAALERRITQLYADRDQTLNTLLDYLTLHASHPDSIRLWMGHYKQPSADVHTALHYFQSGNPVAADSVLNGIAQQYLLTDIQNTDISQVRNMLTAINGQDILNIDSVTLAGIIPLAEETVGWSRLLSRSILLEYGYAFSSAYQLPSDITERNNRRTDQGNRIPAPPYIYPNPTRGECHIIVTPACGVESGIQVYDGLGRLVKRVEVPPGTNEVSLQTADWPVGIYAVEYRCGGRLVFAERLMVSE